MQITLIGTGNMARGIGSRVPAGGHALTVVGKDAQRAEAVAAATGLLHMAVHNTLGTGFASALKIVG
jgi:3-hydroxyisobutyrate dehydrogenase-like beta-hydroxyacid dehydrogenase